MTPLTIIPNYDKKRLKCYGTVAAGEHVLVTVTGGADWVMPDGATQTLRLRLLFGPHTVGVFPFVTEEMSEEDPETFPTPDAWDTTGDDPTCDLNLNTIQAAKFLKFGGNCLVVLDDPTNDILYATGECEVLPWPKRRGADLPYDLDGYPDFVAEAKNAMAEAAANAQNAADSAATAVETVNAALETADNFVNRAETAATNAQNSANGASNSKQDAEAWAVGERGGAAVGSDDETYHNNAKYYAEQAGDAKTDAETAQGAAESAQAAAEAWATGGTGGTPSATNNAKYYAERAEETLEDKADKATTYTKTETDGAIESAVSAEATARNAAIADAISAVKDSAPEAFDTLKEIADWIGGDTSGAQAVINQVTNKVDKVGGKGLSTNDYTTAEKTKLAGIESGAEKNVGVEFTQAEKTKLAGIAANANNYSLPPATAATLGGVKQGTGCEIAADGTLNVTGGGGGGETPIAPSTDASAQGKPADAKATGDALAGKRGKTDYTAGGGWVLCRYFGGEISEVVWLAASGGTWGGGGYLLTFTDMPEGKYSLTEEGTPVGDVLADAGSVSLAFEDALGEPVVLVRGSRLALDTEVAGKQDALSAAQLANIAAVPGKADAADLRYRIAEAVLTASLPSGVTVCVYADSTRGDDVTGDTYFERDTDNDAIYLKIGNTYLVEWDGDGTNGAYDELPEILGYGVFDSSDNLESTPPDLDFSYLVADRTENLITATDETSIDIELPAAVTVDGVRYARDFFLDIDNSANASDLALEFTKLGSGDMMGYTFVTDEDDDIAEMMTVESGKRARLYFTETPYGDTSGAAIQVARVTLGDFVTSTTPATQGGN